MFGIYPLFDLLLTLAFCHCLFGYLQGNSGHLFALLFFPQGPLLPLFDDNLAHARRCSLILSDVSSARQLCAFFCSLLVSSRWHRIQQLYPNWVAVVLGTL